MACLACTPRELHMQNDSMKPCCVQFEMEFDPAQDGQLFDALGVGLGRQEMYSISLAVKKLGEDAKRGVASVGGLS